MKPRAPLLIVLGLIYAALCVWRPWIMGVTALSIVLTIVMVYITGAIAENSWRWWKGY